MNRKLALLTLLIPAGAFANGAMGLGLEVWDLTYWYAYVAAIVVVEAWLIGRKLGVEWGKSLFISVVANALTGVVCGGLGLASPFLHQSFAGSRIDPNPLLHSVILLTVFAVPSAIFEAILWRRATKDASLDKVAMRSIAIHLATIPLALAILLIPDKPYKGMMGEVQFQRLRARREVAKAVQAYVEQHGKTPSSATIPELLAELKPFLEKHVDPVAFYDPSYTRFSTKDNRDRAWRINPDALNQMTGTMDKPLDVDKSVWLLDSPYNDQSGTISIELATGEVWPR